MIPCLVVQTFCFVSYLQGIYTGCLTQKDASLLIYCFNLLLVFFVGCSVFCYQKLLRFLEVVPELEGGRLFENNSLALTYYLGLGFGLLSVFVYVTNFMQRKRLYLILGMSLLLVAFTLSCLNQTNVRNAKAVKSVTVQNCKHLLSRSPKEWLGNHHCPKYLEKTITEGQTTRRFYDMSSCPPENVTYVWEDDVASKQPLNQKSCLNLSCCSVLADSYQIWFLRFSFFVFLLIESTLLLVFLAFQMSQKLKLTDFRQFFESPDVLFFVLLALSLLGAYFYGFHQSATRPLGNFYQPE